MSKKTKSFEARKPCPCCGRYANRGIAIDAIIVRDGQVLLIKRAREPAKDRWAFPGGHIDWDESVEEAVVREVKEETNLTVTSTKLLGVYSRPSRHPDQVIAVAYLVEISGQPQAGDDAAQAKYFPLSDLPPLAFDHLKMIKDFLKEKKGEGSY